MNNSYTLADATYTAVIERDRMCRTRVKELEAVILTTHPKK